MGRCSEEQQLPRNGTGGFRRDFAAFSYSSETSATGEQRCLFLACSPRRGVEHVALPPRSEKKGTHRERKAANASSRKLVERLRASAAAVFSFARQRKKIKGPASEQSLGASDFFSFSTLATTTNRKNLLSSKKSLPGLPFFNADMAAAAHYLTNGGMPGATAGSSPSSAAAAAGNNSASWAMAGLPLTAMAFPGKPPAVAASAANAPAAAGSSRPLNPLEVAELRAARERAIKAAEGRRATAVQARTHPPHPSPHARGGGGAWGVKAG